MKMRLEKYSESDRALYERLVFNEETMGMNLGRTFTEEEAAFFFQAVLEQNSEGNEFGFYKVFVGEPEKEEYIGMGAITQNEEYEAPEIEYMLLPQFWNKGYGTELVEILLNMVKGSATIVAITDPNNIYSRKILLKTGFESVKQYRNDDDEPAELFRLKRQIIVLRDMVFGDIED
jgi:RimJ/RimL family protein N-acetyltransferase